MLPTYCNVAHDPNHPEPPRMPVNAASESTGAE